MQQPLNSESILTKEQLYDMFQQILGVKKFEHQILYNALMVSLTLVSAKLDYNFFYTSSKISHSLLFPKLGRTFLRETDFIYNVFLLTKHIHYTVMHTLEQKDNVLLLS